MQQHDTDSSGALDFMEFVAMICASGDAFKLKISDDIKAEVLTRAKETHADMLANPESAVARRARWKTEERSTDLYNDICAMFVLEEEDGELYKVEKTTQEDLVRFICSYYQSTGMVPLCKSQVEVEAVVEQATAHITGDPTPNPNWRPGSILLDAFMIRTGDGKAAPAPSTTLSPPSPNHLRTHIPNGLLSPFLSHDCGGGYTFAGEKFQADEQLRKERLAVGDNADLLPTLPGATPHQRHVTFEFRLQGWVRPGVAI